MLDTKEQWKRDIQTIGVFVLGVTALNAVMMNTAQACLTEHVSLSTLGLCSFALPSPLILGHTKNLVKE